MSLRFVLASSSPARLATLRAAGLDPEVIVADVDEESVSAASVPALVQRLADWKATTVADRIPADARGRTLVLGCDSLLELDGEPLGKPHTAARAVERWRVMRGRRGVLHTGHCVIELGPAGRRQVTGTASTGVAFADLSDAEIDAYVATGEPLKVAGAFTLDGYGGPFVTGVDGDPHAVVGVSLPLLRRLLADLEVFWPDLWMPSATEASTPPRIDQEQGQAPAGMTGSSPSGPVVVACDGSCDPNPGPGGWCWYVDDRCWSSGNAAATTNNAMELTAVLDFLQVTDGELDEVDTVILCDSAYTIGCLTTWWRGWQRNGWKNSKREPVKNRDLIEEAVRLLARRTATRFEKVKGHSGHGLNEAADERAGAAGLALRYPDVEHDLGPGWALPEPS